MSRIDITGEKYNKLTALYEVEPYIDVNGRSYRKWHVRCDCGNEINVLQSSLRCGKVKSCGCLKIEATIKHRKSNTYDLNGDYGIGYSQNGDIFFFDIEDYDLIKDYYWSKDKRGYITGHLTGSIKQKQLHRIIMNANEDEIVDHISHDLFDNRKINLRIVDRSKNGMNAIRRCDNTSGFRGVYFRSDTNKWRATIYVNNSLISLGCYKDIEDAIAVRKAAEEKFFGEYSFDNSQTYAQQYAIPEQQLTNIK